MSLDSGELLPEVGVTLLGGWMLFVQDGPDEGVETLVGDSLVVDGESHQ